MEHRCSTRMPIAGSVIVSRPTHDRVRAGIANIGVGGIYIETQERFPPNAIVLVDLLLPTGNQFQLRAMVIHRTSGGAGLMFEDFETKTARMLRATLDRYATSESDAARRQSTRAA